MVGCSGVEVGEWGMNPIPPSSTTGEDRVCRVRNEVINKITGGSDRINCDVEHNAREIRAIIVTNEEVLQRCSSSLRHKGNSPRTGFSPFGPPVGTYFRRSYEDIVVKSLDTTCLAAVTQPNGGFSFGGPPPPTLSATRRAAGTHPPGFSFGRSPPPPTLPPPAFSFAGFAASGGNDRLPSPEKEKKKEQRKRIEYSVKFELTQEYSEKTFNMSLLSKLPSNLDGVLSQDPTLSDRIDYSKLLDRTYLLHEDIQGPYLGALKDHLMNIQVLLGGIETWIIEGSQNADFVEETFGVDLNDLFKDEVAEDVTKILKECESTLFISAEISLSSDTDRLQLIKLIELIDIKPKHDGKP